MGGGHRWPWAGHGEQAQGCPRCGNRARLRAGKWLLTGLPKILPPLPVSKRKPGPPLPRTLLFCSGAPRVAGAAQGPHTGIHRLKKRVSQDVPFDPQTTHVLLWGCVRTARPHSACPRKPMSRGLSLGLNSVALGTAACDGQLLAEPARTSAGRCSRCCHGRSRELEPAATTRGARGASAPPLPADEHKAREERQRWTCPVATSDTEIRQGSVCRSG